MKSPLVLLLIPLLTIGAFYVSPQGIRPAHADGPVGVGLVCIADTTATSCPIVPPTIAGPGPNGNPHFFVSVIVNDSVALNGFGITLLTDVNVLRPSGVTIGNFLSNTQEVVKCIGGVNELGSSACPTQDNGSTIDYSVTGAISGAPATGVLFQADYLVVGNTANSRISFQTGCTNTSVSGGVCVTISSGATAFDVENFQIAKFTNILGGYFDITPSTRTIQLAKGDSDTNDFVNVVSLNQFSGTVTISASCSPAGPICTVPPPADVMISPGNPSFAGLNVTVPKTVSPGTYTLNITGTSGSLPPNSVTIQLIIPAPDFTIAANPSSLKFNVTASGLANITLSSSGNFNGTVTLSVKINDPALARATLLNQTLMLSAKGSNSTKLTVTATIQGGYSVNVTATSGTLSHSSTVSVTVLDFFLQVPNKVLTVVNGSSTGSSETVAVNVNAFYNVTVTFSNTVYVNTVIQNAIVGPSSGLNVSCSPRTLVIISLKNSTFSKLGTGATDCKVTARDIGDYTVTVTAISGVGNRTSVHAVTFPVTVIAKGFSVALSTSVETVAVSGSTSLNVTIVGNGLGLNDTINVKLEFSSSNLSPLPDINPRAENVSITPTSQNSTITATITASSSTPAGDYTLTITASGHIHQSNPVRITVTMLLIVVETASPHDVAVNYAKPSTTSATIGSTVNITITVINNGKLPENVTIQAIVADQTVGVMNVTDLAPGQNVTVTIPWNTSGYSSGAYMIGGKVKGVNGETNLSDNLLRYSTPVTLNPANTSILNNAYTVPIIIIGVIIVAAIAMGLFLLPRRRPVPVR